LAVALVRGSAIGTCGPTRARRKLYHNVARS
jgi:hypothetical protein